MTFAMPQTHARANPWCDKEQLGCELLFEIYLALTGVVKPFTNSVR